MTLNYDELRAMPGRPRLHPNGFIQLDLVEDKSLRLHVWPDSRLENQKTMHPIHDHSFDMDSTILTGCLTNLVYEFQPSEYNAQVTLYQAQRLAGSQDTVLAPAKLKLNTGYLCLLGSFSKLYMPSAKYTLRKRLLHDSIAHGLTATLMKKTNVSTYSPLIAVPAGVVPDNDYSREDIQEEVLWHFIKKALDKIEAEKIVKHKVYA